MSHELEKSPVVPVVFGDVALVRYPNGDEVLGGQAFGIAWHLQGLGQPVLLVTRVGDDEVTADALRAMEQWELPTLGVQHAGERSLGRVEVQPGNEAPRVTAPEDQPWDRISAEEAARAVKKTGCALLVHGTRCLRSATNRRALDRLIEETGAPIYFDATNDVSLLEKDELERRLARSKWVTVRQSELPIIAARLDLVPGEPDDLAERLRSKYAMAALFVIADVNGAYAVSESNHRHRVVPSGDLDVIDRVGVEEAFSAIAIYGLLAGWSIAKILQRAQGFVELVAALPAPEIPTGAFYDDVREQWAVGCEREHRERVDGSPVRATSAIPKEARLPAELEEAADQLEELRERQESARMRAAVASQQVEPGNTDSSTALARAKRSVKKIAERIHDTKQRLRSLRRTAKKIQTEHQANDEKVGPC